MTSFDAAVVGAGPNGLAAALELARSGARTLLVEAADEIGGGTRTGELTLPGFKHDICSAIHPAAIASPFFDEIALEVDWVQPPIPFAHPLDDGQVAVLHRSVDETAAGLGEDEDRYRDLMAPFVERIDKMIDVALGPVSVIPDNPLAFTRLGLVGGLPAALLAKRFSSERPRLSSPGCSPMPSPRFTPPLPPPSG
jgi:phytoene dehydrogenase-like protein